MRSWCRKPLYQAEQFDSIMLARKMLSGLSTGCCDSKFKVRKAAFDRKKEFRKWKLIY